MAIRFSSIHAALGVTGSLDHALLIQAIKEQVAEDEHLDWKRQLPADGDEVAKDAAALANSRGGLLVYGVSENRPTARAASAMPVSLAENEQRRIRSWLNTRIHPVISGVEFHPLRAAASDTDGFLVVSVPESPDAPHAVGKDNSLGFPYRVGAQTFWMREWDLDRAYRERFARQAAEETHLAELIDHVEDQLDMDNGCWLVGAARPSIPVPRTMPAPSRDAVVAMIESSQRHGTDIAPVSDRRAEIIKALDNAMLNPRVGLRRWIAATRTTYSPEIRSDLVHLELHHDGSIVLAVRLDGWYSETIDGKHCVPDFMVTGFAVDFTALINRVAEATDHTGQTLVRIELRRGDDAPFAFLAPERGAPTLAQPIWTRDVRRFVPVSIAVPRAENLEQMRDTSRTIATDIVTQFGYPASDLHW